MSPCHEVTCPSGQERLAWGIQWVNSFTSGDLDVQILFRAGENEEVVECNLSRRVASPVPVPAAGQALTPAKGKTQTMEKAGIVFWGWNCTTIPQNPKLQGRGKKYISKFVAEIILESEFKDVMFMSHSFKKFQPYSGIGCFYSYFSN